MHRCERIVEINAVKELLLFLKVAQQLIETNIILVPNSNNILGINSISSINRYNNNNIKIRDIQGALKLEYNIVSKC